MVKSSLCDYSDAHMDAQRTITVPDTGLLENLSNLKSY